MNDGLDSIGGLRRPRKKKIKHTLVGFNKLGMIDRCVGSWNRPFLEGLKLVSGAEHTEKRLIFSLCAVYVGGSHSDITGILQE